MAYNFPSTPAEDQEFTPAGGATYVYKAPRWLVKSVAYLPLTGGTLTGTLTISSAGALVVQSTTASVSPITGALQVAGGAGVAGEVYARSFVASGTDPSIYFQEPGPVNHWQIKPWIGNGDGLSFWQVGTGLPWVVFQKTSGTVNILSTTPSNSPSTGALTIGGGLGVGGEIYSGNITIQSSAFSQLFFNDGAGARIWATGRGGDNNYRISATGIADWIAVNRSAGNVTIGSTVASPNPGIGALTVAGGLGVAGDIRAGSGIFGALGSFGAASPYVQIASSGGNGNSLVLMAHTSGGNYFDTVGDLQVRCGPTSLASNVFLVDKNTGNVAFQSATPSNSPGTGALTVAGGLGVGGAAFISGGINATAAGGPGPTITSIDSRGGGATISMAANYNGLGQPGLYSTGAFPLQFGVNALTKMQLTAAGDLQVLNNTLSNSPTTGALTIPNGGLGVGGALWVNGTQAASAVVQQWGMYPGVNVSLKTGADAMPDFGTVTAHHLYLKANEVRVLRVSPSGSGLPDVGVLPTTPSSSPTTGALTVAGGIGCGGNFNVGGVVGIGVANSTQSLKVQGVSGQFAAYLLGANSTNASHGVIIDAGTGTDADTNFLCRDASGASSFLRIGGNGGMVVGTPTGGNKGIGTLNATAVYDDNVLLTCFGVEYLKYGQIDLAYWDSVSPSGEHAPARKFAEMVTEFDPRDPRQYIKRMLQDEALPGMPTKAEWRQNQLSLGEMNNKLWLAVELLASAFAGALDRIELLEKQKG
jgi:hypothetical protein